MIDLHDKTPQQKRLNSLHISEVCQHCKGVIEWKIKYKKYKALTQAKTCTKCSQKKIRKAYHVLCRDCALEARVCAKCLKSAEEVEIEPAQPTQAEEQKLKAEMERLIKSFPERKRRVFLRYMDKGKKDKENAEHLEENGEEGQDKPENDAEVDADNIKIKTRVPHTRDELLLKIEQLTLKNDEDDDYDEFDSDDDDDFDEDGDSDEEDFSDE